MRLLPDGIVAAAFLAGFAAFGQPKPLGTEVQRWLPREGLVAGSSFDGSLAPPGPQRVQGLFGQGFHIGEGGPVELPGADGKPAGNWDRDQVFSVSAWFRCDPDASGPKTLVARMDGTAARRGWTVEVLPIYGQVAFTAQHQENANVLRVVTLGKSFELGTWRHALVTYDGSSKASGVKVHIDGNLIPHRVVRDTLSASILTPAPATVGQRSGTSYLYKAKQMTIDELRIYDRVLEDLEAERLGKLAPGKLDGKAAAVRVESRTGQPLSLAEVEVWSGGQNVARFGQATQSSNYHGDDTMAVRAIDGNNNGGYNNGSVSHTAMTDTKAWWQVDLAFEMPIERMVVFNRWDGAQLARRLDGAEILVLDATGRVLWKQKLAAPAPRRTELEVGLVDLPRLVPAR